MAGKELLYIMIHSAKDKARHTVSATNQDAPLAIRRRKLLYSPAKSLFEVRPSITVMHSLDDEQPPKTPNVEISRYPQVPYKEDCHTTTLRRSPSGLTRNKAKSVPDAEQVIRRGWGCQAARIRYTQQTLEWGGPGLQHSTSYMKHSTPTPRKARHESRAQR